MAREGLILYWLAQVVSEQTRHTEAENLIIRSVKLLHQELGEGNVATLLANVALGTVLGREAKFEESERLLRLTLNLMELHLGNQCYEYFHCCFELAEVLDQSRQHTLALQFAETSVAGYKKIGDQQPLDLARTQYLLARIHFSLGNFKNALPFSEGSYKLIDSELPHDDPERNTNALLYAILLQENGRHAEAKKISSIAESGFQEKNQIDRLGSSLQLAKGVKKRIHGEKTRRKNRR